MKYSLLFLFLASLLLISTGARAQCDATKAMVADQSVDYLKTWQAVYHSYRKYHSCDDGAIAEGYSDAVVKLLANDWRELFAMQKLAMSDPGFYRFVIKHIDATTDWDDLKNIIMHASRECPKNAKNICTVIKHRAEDAYKEARSDVGSGPS